MKVKILSHSTPTVLEHDVNFWLSANSAPTITDTVQSALPSKDDSPLSSGMLIILTIFYTETEQADSRASEQSDRHEEPLPRQSSARP
jgi:hypothetical protein